MDSLAYNTGPNFINDDRGFGTIISAIRSGEAKVADALPLYDNGGLPGLTRRRAEEAELAITPAMDPIDSTLANDRIRALFGTEAVLDGKPVMWGGQDYGWQSPSVFETITPPAPTPIERQEPGPMKSGFRMD